MARTLRVPASNGAWRANGGGRAAECVCTLRSTRAQGGELEAFMQQQSLKGFEKVALRNAWKTLNASANGNGQLAARQLQSPPLLHVARVMGAALSTIAPPPAPAPVIAPPAAPAAQRTRVSKKGKVASCARSPTNMHTATHHTTPHAHMYTHTHMHTHTHTHSRARRCSSLAR